MLGLILRTYKTLRLSVLLVFLSGRLYFYSHFQKRKLRYKEILVGGGWLDVSPLVLLIWAMTISPSFVVLLSKCFAQMAYWFNCIQNLY